ncbi:alpha/beta hydrolase [Pseudomonas sp. LRF_L74]|uniref:alpha/beta hydrolase n=1 Tax=Pseudomonas sp. LRF_L74 TaxID=3369422 RepID=UPI003F62E9F4
MSRASFSDLQREPASGLRFRRREDVRAPRARLLLLHGVGGNESNLAALADYLPGDVEVLLLQAPLPIGVQAYAWFQVSFTASGPRIDAGQAESSRERLLAFISAQATLPTVIAGFSQGGIMSASVGLSAPELVTGFGLLSGRILPELEPRIAASEALRGLSAFVAHGRHDDKLPLFWAERATQRLQSLQVSHQTRLYDMGHELIHEEIQDFADWLKQPLRLD